MSNVPLKADGPAASGAALGAAPPPQEARTAAPNAVPLRRKNSRRLIGLERLFLVVGFIIFAPLSGLIGFVFLLDGQFGILGFN
jgi:hypothetical protein